MAAQMGSSRFAGRRGRKRFLKRKKPLSLAKKVRKIQFRATETKYFDRDEVIGQPPIDTSGLGYVLGGIPTGDSNVERIGTRIHPVRLHVRCRFRMQAAATEPCVVRCILIQMRNTNDPPPGLGQLLESGINLTLQQWNYDDKKEWTVYHDKKYTMTDENSNQQVVFDIVKTKLNEMVYSGTGALANCKGQVCIFFVSDQSDAAAQPLLQFTSRLFYKDV